MMFAARQREKERSHHAVISDHVNQNLNEMLHSGANGTLSVVLI
jgi:hypothetical protein